MPRIARYLVRKAAIHDAPRIAEIQVGTWQVAYRGLMPDEYLNGLDLHRRVVVWKQLIGAPEETVLVAVQGERIVGFCDVLRSRDSAATPEIAEIATIYVEPEAWGRGAGTSLMEAALDHATSHGFVAVTLWVLENNARARRFYEKVGFAPDGAGKSDHLRGFPVHEVRYRRGLKP